MDSILQNIDFLIGVFAWSGFALFWATLLDDENKLIIEWETEKNKEKVKLRSYIDAFAESVLQNHDSYMNCLYGTFITENPNMPHDTAFIFNKPDLVMPTLNLDLINKEKFTSTTYRENMMMHPRMFNSLIKMDIS